MFKVAMIFMTLLVAVFLPRVFMQAEFLSAVCLLTDRHRI